MYSPTSTTTLINAQDGQPLVFNDTVSNPDLSAEKSLNVELGYRWSTERAQLGLSVFRDRYDNFIEYSNLMQSIPGGFRTTATGPILYERAYSMPTNAGEVTVKGVELEGRWQISDAWSTRTAASYSEGEAQRRPAGKHRAGQRGARRALCAVAGVERHRGGHPRGGQACR